MIKTMNGWEKMSENVKDIPMWIFVNKTTGTLIEHPNLNSLLFELKSVHGLNIPQHVDIDLLLYKRVDIEVTDENGDTVSIAIGEHHPTRNIYFDKIRPLN